jgi:ParB family chromosome partitioning protein
MMATIPLDLIDDGQRLRGISEAQVEALVNSIADIGLLNPISVYRRKLMRAGAWVDGYGLIAGLHRKTAYERLGLAEIDAVVLDLDDLQRQIAECDENLCGSVLTPSERARFTARRKDAYEALHPETRQHVAGGLARQDTANDKLSFAASTAAATGKDERTVQRDAERGEKVTGEALDLIRGTKLDTGVYLDKLKKLDRDEQIAMAKNDLAALKEVRLQAPQHAPATSKLDADIRHRADRANAEILAEYLPAEAWDHFKANAAVGSYKGTMIEFANIVGASVFDRSAA